MPTPQYSPVLYPTGFPYSEWMKHTSSVKEINELCKVFNGTPKSWVEWVESQIASACKNGIVIDKPLNYRLALMWNGIISLQEGKYICDCIENAFRHRFLECLSLSNVSLLQLLKSVPDYGAIVASYEAGNVDIGSVSNNDILISFSFYQLTETMVRNWKYMSGITPRITGFNQIFWNHKHCRDVNKLQKDSKTIREYRNIIAHSRKLLARHEVQELYDVSQVWLKPIDIDLDEKIRAYRRKRPYFLAGLLQ